MTEEQMMMMMTEEELMSWMIFLSVVIVMQLLVSIWNLIDARTRKNSFGWSISTLILGPFIVFPFYFAFRNLKAGEIRVGGSVWHIFRNYTLSWTVLIIFSVATAIIQLDLEAVKGFVGFFMAGIIWFVVAFFIMVLGLFFK